jgi:iron complex transport system ATP-binding protein
VMLGRLPHRGRWGAPSADDERAVDRVLRLAQCEHLTARMVDSLSAGERQRVHLARAHAVEARVVLLDEPVAHLDAPHQAQWLESVREATGAGVTIVAVLHDLNLALQADAMWVMGGGTLLAAGAPGDAAVLAAIDRVFGGRMVVHRVDGRLRAWVQ